MKIKMSTFLVTFATFIFFNNCGSASNVEEAFKESGIVPDIIPSKPPPNKLTVSYSDVIVDLGNELTLNITQTEPVVVYNANNETLYTLIMVDPDVPKRQNATYRSHLHWWIINIQGSAVTDGCFVTDYAGPTPAVGTDLHRYVFLVFKQDKRIYHNEDSRSRFSVPDVINELGDPVYGNFFQAQAA